MRRGTNRSFVRIEKPIKTKTASGSFTTTWSLFANMWVSINNMRGYEKQSSGAAWPGCDTRIEMDFIEGMLPTFRVIYNNKIYSILGIDDIEERHRDINLICQTGLKSS